MLSARTPAVHWDVRRWRGLVSTYFSIIFFHFKPDLAPVCRILLTLQDMSTHVNGTRTFSNAIIDALSFIYQVGALRAELLCDIWGVTRSCVRL